jgi:hypothetical protein
MNGSGKTIMPMPCAACGLPASRPVVTKTHSNRNRTEHEPESGEALRHAALEAETDRKRDRDGKGGGERKVRRDHTGREPADRPRARRAGRCVEHTTAAEIAQHLHLSEGTVRNYLSSAMRKLRARNRAEAIRVAEHEGRL